MFVGQLSSISNCSRILQGVEMTMAKVLVPLLTGQEVCTMLGVLCTMYNVLCTMYIVHVPNYLQC